MKLSDFYQEAIKFGKIHDPRKKSQIKSYEDSAVLYGAGDTEIKKILIGIDIEVGELLLADRIRSRQGLDLVLAHHPEGHAYASLDKVMRLQVELLRKIGLNKKVAQELLEVRQREVKRRILPNNHARAVDAAKLIDLPFMCLHTPADNHVFSYLTHLMNMQKPKKAQEIIDILMTIPEYQSAAKENAGPQLIAGSPNRGVGKILVEMTGGTEGSREVYDKLYKTGVRTLICMHLSEEHFKKVKDNSLNVVIAGHISSDTLGLNLLLDNIERSKKEKFLVTVCSGFRRIRRN
jgi:putative NIF3 family GTP cyclohydrolase 1 type 2